jgi:coenzyme F420-reducing hydrogenase delta subunit
MSDVIGSLDLTFHVSALAKGVCMLCKLLEDAAADTGDDGVTAAGASSSACTFSTGDTENRLLLRGDIVVITESSDKIPTKIK